MKKQLNYLLEICCYNAHDVLIAEEGGAHRVELCSGYEVGGTTPSLGQLIVAKSLSKLPIYVMIRPRGGNFTYSSSEKKVILKDIEQAINYNADGIVFGALNLNNTVDKEFCKAVVGACGKTPTTFHRAIDICEDYTEAIHFLAEIGVRNILTSGGKIKAEQGIQQLKKMHECAQNNIHIMAGSGVNADNILSFAQLGLSHFHSSASIIDKKNDEVDKIGFNATLKNNELSVVSKSKVQAMVQQLNTFF